MGGGATGEATEEPAVKQPLVEQTLERVAQELADSTIKLLPERAPNGVTRTIVLGGFALVLIVLGATWFGLSYRLSQLARADQAAQKIEHLEAKEEVLAPALDRADDLQQRMDARLERIERALGIQTPAAKQARP